MMTVLMFLYNSIKINVGSTATSLAKEAIKDASETIAVLASFGGNFNRLYI